MTEQLMVVATVLAAMHALTYARWMKQNGNNAGAYMVFMLSIIGIGVVTWRTFFSA